MEGYSVTEAASVLGVPTERVWELLARGILAGSPDGETGMRVYLQPRAAAPPASEPSPFTRGNGADREPERETSPFRDLLTEFRNLTERYGQALLALGESRGEVATLRSRVDLLEARMDLRLPMNEPAAPPPGTWAAPSVTAPTVRSADGPVDARPVPADSAGRSDDPLARTEDVDVDDDVDRRGRRRRAGHRRATESFAEALARAEDPTAPELPSATEAGAALAAMRERAHEVPPADAGLPRELPAAEAIDLAEEAGPAAPVASLPSVSPPVTPPAPAVEGPPSAAAPAAVPATEPAVELSDAPTAAPLAEPATEPSATPPAAEIGPLPEATTAGPEREQEVAPESVGATGPESEAPLVAEPVPADMPEPDPAAVLEGAASEIALPAAPAAAAIADTAEAEAEVDTVEAEAEAAAPAATTTTTDAPSPALVEREPIEWDPERYTVDIADPDWYAEEDVTPTAVTAATTTLDEPSAPAPPALQAPALEADSHEETAPPEPPSGVVAQAELRDIATVDAGSASELEARPTDVGEDAIRATVEASPPGTDEPTPPAAPEPAAPMTAAPHRDEETMLWFGRTPASAPTPPAQSAPPSAEASAGTGAAASPTLGADEIEVAGASGRPDRTPRREPASLPGAWELDDALAALDALAGRSRAGPAEPEPATASEPAWPAEPPTSVEEPAAVPASAHPPAASGATPASRAYRRLRRIFPG